MEPGEHFLQIPTWHVLNRESMFHYLSIMGWNKSVFDICMIITFSRFIRNHISSPSFRVFVVLIWCSLHINILRPRWNEQHFVDDIFKRISFNGNAWISIKISLKFVPKGPINNILALVQIMAWRLSGDKPLSEPMMVSLPTHICVTRPQWVKSLVLLANIMGHAHYMKCEFSKTKVQH